MTYKEMLHYYEQELNQVEERLDGTNEDINTVMVEFLEGTITSDELKSELTTLRGYREELLERKNELDVKLMDLKSDPLVMVEVLDIVTEGLHKIGYYVESMSDDLRGVFNNDKELEGVCRAICMEYKIEWVWDQWDSCKIDKTFDGVKNLGENMRQLATVLNWAVNHDQRLEPFKNQKSGLFNNRTEDVGFYLWEMGTALCGLVEIHIRLGLKEEDLKEVLDR